MKKTLVGFLCFALLTMLAFGSAAAEGGKLFGYIPEGRHNEGIIAGDSIKKFEEANPGWTVEAEVVPDIQTKAKISISAGERVDFCWSPGSDWPRIWGEMNAMVDLSPYLAAEGYDIYDYFAKGYADELSYNGQQIALPTDCFSYALWYNKVILEANGVAIPEYNQSYTREEFEDALAKCTTGDTWGLSTYLPSWHIVQPYYNAFGARIVSEDGAAAVIDSPEYKAFLTYYADIYNKYGRPLPIAPTDSEWDETWTNGFLAGKCAFLVGAPWTITEANKMEAENPDAFQWGTTMIPRFNDNPEPFSIGGTAGWAIPSTCPEENRAAAFRLIWEFSVGSGAQWWYDDNAMYATLVGLENFQNHDPARNGGWIEMTKHLVPMEQIVCPAWQSAVEPVLMDTVNAAFLGRMSVDDALSQAQTRIDQAIAEYVASME